MESQGLAVLFRGHSFQFSADGQEYCSVSLEVWVSGKMRQTTVPRVTKSSLYHSLAVCKWFHFSKPHLSRLLIRNSNRCPLYFVRLSASESPVTVVTKHLSVMGYHIIMPIVLPFYYEFALYGSSFVFIFIFLYLLILSLSRCLCSTTYICWSWSCCFMRVFICLPGLIA